MSSQFPERERVLGRINQLLTNPTPHNIRVSRELFEIQVRKAVRTGVTTLDDESQRRMIAIVTAPYLEPNDPGETRGKAFATINVLLTSPTPDQVRAIWNLFDLQIEVAMIAAAVRHVPCCPVTEFQ